MAKTDGRTNPPWTRDETILALDLFFEAGMVGLPDSDSRTIELSNVLRALPGNEERSSNPRFRNPAGVSFKLFNLQNLASGGGFANVSAMDRAVWSQFETRRARVREISQLIILHVADAPLNSNPSDDEEEFAEGSVFTVLHKRIERNRLLRSKLIKARKTRGQLRCDVCGITSGSEDPRFEDAIFEAHHVVPLHTQGATKTKLSDTALLCANCHRLTHRVIAKSGKWISIHDIRMAIASATNQQTS